MLMAAIIELARRRAAPGAFSPLLRPSPPPAPPLPLNNEAIQREFHRCFQPGDGTANAASLGRICPRDIRAKAALRWRHRQFQASRVFFKNLFSKKKNDIFS